MLNLKFEKPGVTMLIPFSLDSDKAELEAIFADMEENYPDFTYTGIYRW